MNAREESQPRVRLLLLDVDGVLTDGTLWYDARGELLKSFNVRDGLAVALLRSHGIDTGVISGRSSEALNSRIEHLGIDLSITGRLEKVEALSQILQRTGLDACQIAYVGDDVVDLPLVGRVGFFYAPKDAHPLVLERADHVLLAPGGRGAAREAAEDILARRGIAPIDMYRSLLGDWSKYDAAQ